jgi:hypothetical protein
MVIVIAISPNISARPDTQTIARMLKQPNMSVRAKPNMPAKVKPLVRQNLSAKAKPPAKPNRPARARLLTRPNQAKLDIAIPNQNNLRSIA